MHHPIGTGQREESVVGTEGGPCNLYRVAAARYVKQHTASSVGQVEAATVEIENDGTRTSGTSGPGGASAWASVGLHGF